MGTLTAAGIIAQVRGILGCADTNLISDTIITAHINAAYQIDVSNQLDLPELDATDAENTAASTATTAFSVTDVLSIKGIVDNNGIPLKEITANEYDRLWARTGTITGTPTHWHRTGSTTSGTITVRWYPVPNAVYSMTMNYKKRPTAISSSGATAIDALYDEPIVYYAASKSAAYLRMYDDALKLKQYADGLLSRAQKDQIGSSAYLWQMGGMEEMS